MVGRLPQYIKDDRPIDLVRAALAYAQGDREGLKGRKPTFDLILRRSEICSELRHAIEKHLSAVFSAPIAFRSDKLFRAYCRDRFFRAYCSDQDASGQPYIDLPAALESVYLGKGELREAIYLLPLLGPLEFGSHAKYKQILSYVIRTRFAEPDRYSLREAAVSEAERDSWRERLPVAGELEPRHRRFLKSLLAAPPHARRPYEGAIAAMQEHDRLSYDGGNPTRNSRVGGRNWLEYAGDLFENVEGLVHPGIKARPQDHTIRRWANRGREHIKSGSTLVLPECVVLPPIDGCPLECKGRDCPGCVDPDNIHSLWRINWAGQRILAPVDGFLTEEDFEARAYFRPRKRRRLAGTG